MLIIQLLIVLFALHALTRTFLRFRHGTIGLTEWLIWSGFWLAVGICVLEPGITQLFARVLGVGRGADAVFYLGLVSLSYAYFRLYVRSRHQDQQITLLVRRLALREVDQEDGLRAGEMRGK
jgi:hypothetical protein